MDEMDETSLNLWRYAENHPTDPLPRLVLADHLEEVGGEPNAAWARLLRLGADSFGVAKRPTPLECIIRSYPTWEHPVTRLLDLPVGTVASDRGLPAWSTRPLQGPQPDRTAAPIRGVFVTSPDDLASLGRIPRPPLSVVVVGAHTVWNDGGLWRLAAHPLLAEVQRLVLFNLPSLSLPATRPAGRLGRVTDLTLEWCHYHDKRRVDVMLDSLGVGDGVTAFRLLGGAHSAGMLAAVLRFPRLIELTLAPGRRGQWWWAGSGMPRRILRLLGNLPRGLRHLDLWDTWMSAGAVSALAGSPAAATLTGVRITVPASPAVADVLADRRAFPVLADLSVNGSLAGPPDPDRVRQLVLGEPVGAAG